MRSRDAPVVPDWFRDAKLGIFVHWGAYAVPAWAEPSGELGELDDADFFRRNPYAEWYGNSMRIVGGPTAQHHREVYGDAPYDDFLDAWQAEAFDPAAFAELVRRAGARYLVPTTKHHDGIPLWPAPGSGDRTAAARGPRRDLVGELHDAARALGLRFGVYYSGGLDWHAAPTDAILGHRQMLATRPSDPRYAAYAGAHLRDLVDRYRPDVLWNDIEWPEAGKSDTGPLGLPAILADYRIAVPEGVINDRWGMPVEDFRTSEYHVGLENESAAAWEHCRGIGLSFGYNQREGVAEYLDTAAVLRLLADIVSRGGNLLLNVGPRADGTLPDLQLRVLEGLAEWMPAGGRAIHGTRPVDPAAASDSPFVRWTAGADAVYAIVDDPDVQPSRVPAVAVPGSARLIAGVPAGLPAVIEYRRIS